MDKYRRGGLQSGHHLPNGASVAPESLGGALLLALVVQQVAVPGRRPREFGAAVGAARFGGLPGLLSLVPEEVAECRKLSAVAPVLPALRLRPAVHHPDLPVRVRRSRGHEPGDRVHAEVWVLNEWPAARSGISLQVLLLWFLACGGLLTRSVTVGSGPSLAGSRSRACRIAEGTGS